MDIIEIANIHKGRSVAFNVFSKVFADVPTEEKDNLFTATAEHMAMLASSSENPNMKKGLELLGDIYGEDFTKNDLSADRLERNRDYTYLFVLSNVPLYESVYTSPERLLKQEAWSEVKNFYLKNKYRHVDDDKTIEDHIAMEMEFMGYLSRDIAESLEQEKFDEAEEIMRAQLEFYRDHILKWVPLFCDGVITLQGELHTRFYPAYAYLLKGFIEEDIVFLEELLS
jgi:TorA maturation chaperone TorD